MENANVRADGVQQFISFTVGAEEYGVDVLSIREIKGWSAATELPDTPAHIRGVIDLRGTIVPIFDLRARFAGQLTEASARHVIIVVSVDDRISGILVDAVADIITVRRSDIQPVPELDPGNHAGFLAGIVTVEGRMVALLDLSRLFDSSATTEAAALDA